MRAIWRADDNVLQLLCLRLAILLCTARNDPELQALQWSTPKNRSARATVSEAWSQAYPQSYYLLQEEACVWEKVGFDLKVVVQG